MIRPIVALACVVFFSGFTKEKEFTRNQVFDSRINNGELVLYKSLPIRKIEENTPVKSLTIVTPENQEWRELGNLIASTLERRWKSQVKVVASDDAKFSTGWSGNVIILGNLAAKPFLEKQWITGYYQSIVLVAEGRKVI